LVTVENLRRNVIGRAAHGFASLGLGSDFSSKSKVPDPDLKLVSQQQISQFKIPVNDILLVNVFGCNDELMHVVLDFNLSEFLSPLDQFVEGLVIAQFQNDVNELGVFEAVFEFDDVWRLDL
jgi:hypothetical protein